VKFIETFSVKRSSPPPMLTDEMMQFVMVIFRKSTGFSPPPYEAVRTASGMC
jgi:hypothetical protein